MAGGGGWLRGRVGVRVASALSAALVVALSLVVAGGALVFLVGQSLRGAVEVTAQQRAQQIMARIEGNFTDDAKQNAIEALDALTQSDDLVQVVLDYEPDGDSGEKVEAATLAVSDETPISDLSASSGEVTVVPTATISHKDGTTVDASLAVVGGSVLGRPVVVLLAEPLTGVTAATETVLFYLLFGVPLLILVAGLTTYLFAGRALRPVEAIRAQVAEMSEKDLAQRVPVPAARDEVGRLAETMNGMISRLENAQGVQRRFVADASHELRSPLATIATGLELMQRGPVDPSSIVALRGETERISRLVEALLLLARADERGLQPRREEVDLDEVAEAERGRPTERAVVAEVRAEPVRVIGDRGQLARVLRNLVDNARRHARSRVLVTVARCGDTAVVEVSDDGPGVPAADRERVFERFVRLDHARAREDGGSGLGLAIVAEVVAAHGGTVEVEESPGGGALFRMRLPATARSEVPAPDEAEVPAPGAPVPAAPSGTGPAAGTDTTVVLPTASPVPRRGEPLSRPVRDADARVDPLTMPWGLPPVREEDGSADTEPHGIPVTPAQGTPTQGAPAQGAQGTARQPVPPSRARRGQPGSVIR